MNINESPQWDIWDWLKAAGLAATVLTSLGIITNPKARRELGGFATIAGATTALVHMATPPKCPACGARQVSQIAGGYACPCGCM